MRRRLRELLLWLGAAAGLAAVVVALAVSFLDVTFLVFRTGSMGPDLPTGSLALARTVDAADVREGDVVSVLSAEGERITHRVVSSTMRGDEASLVLQGDTNTSPDGEVYVARDVERAVVGVPYAGYVLTAVLSPPGLVVVACAAGALVVVAFTSPGTGGARGGSGGRRRADARPANPARGGRHRAVTVAVATVAVTTVALAGTTGTSAAFTDPARLATGSFTSGTLSPATAVVCSTSAGTNNAFVRWTAPTTGVPPTGYRIDYSATGITPGAVVVGATPLEWRPTGALIADRTYTVRVTALRGANWVSTTSASTTIRVQSLVVTVYNCA